MPPGSDPRRRWTVRAFILCGIAGLVGTIAWIGTRQSPAELTAAGLAAREPAAGERLLRRAVTIANGTYPDAELALCLIRGRQGAWTEVAASFPAINLKACRTTLLTTFAREALEARRGDEALAALEASGWRAEPAAIPALEMLRLVYLELGRQDDVITTSQQLTQRDEGESRYWKQLFADLKAAQREAECLDAIRQALKVDLSEETRRDIEVELIHQLIVVGRSEEAWPLLDELAAAEGESLRVQTCRIDLYRLDGRPEEALQAMSRVFPEISRQPEAFLNRGTLYLDLRRYEDAVRDLKRAVAAMPGNPAAHFKLAESYRGAGDEESARQHREIAVTIARKRERIAALRKRTARGPQSPALYEELSQLYEELGEPEAARENAARAVRAATVRTPD